MKTWETCEEVLGSDEAARRLADGWEPLGVYMHRQEMGWLPDDTWGCLNEYPMLVLKRVVEPSAVVDEEPAACPSWWKGQAGDALRCVGAAGHTGVHVHADKTGCEREWSGPTVIQGFGERCAAKRWAEEAAYRCTQPSRHPGAHNDVAGTTWVD